MNRLAGPGMFTKPAQCGDDNIMNVFGGYPAPDKTAGYAQAARAGRLPSPPEVAPRPRNPDQTAARLINRFLLVFVTAWFGTVIVALVVFQNVPEDSKFSGLLPFVLAAWTVGGAVFFHRWWQRVGEVFLAEILAGYTTSPTGWNSFGLSPTLYRRWVTVQWDFSGLWVLDKDGVVVSEPDRTVRFPAGFYPSFLKGKEDCFLLWTGEMWAQEDRDYNEMIALRNKVL